jgi:SAM-dependent methyltransferase
MNIGLLLHKLKNIPAVKRLLTENRFFVRFYFNWLYRREDPYALMESDYEKAKLALVVETVGAVVGHARSALEIGCGEGKLTGHLAPICDRVVAVDISDLAVARAKKSLADAPHVEVRQADVFTHELTESFDLVVCSEVLFYFEPNQLPGIVKKVADRVAVGGRLLLVHARAMADDTAGIELKKFGAKTIHDRFIADGCFTVDVDRVEPAYRITILRRTT